MNQEVDQSSVTEPPAEVQKEVSNKEYNFRALESKLDGLARENQILQAKILEQERLKEEKNSSFREDDIPTFGDILKMRQQDIKELQSLKNELKEVRMRTKYQDYETTIKEYLPDVLGDEPDLAEELINNPNMHRLAYKLAQASPRYHEQRLGQKNTSAVDKIIENATKSQPSNSRKSAVIQDEATRLDSMTDDQIMEIFNMSKARSY